MPTSRGLGGKGLGKGLGSLIPDDFDQSLLVEAGERVQKIAVAQIHPNPDQPRTIFEAEALAELSESIRQYGIVQPLVVSPVENGYIIIAGERRWRAAKLAKLTKVPAIVRTSQEIERLEIALVENVQRVDLSAIEQAVSIERLHVQFNMAYTDIAKRLGKANSTVTNIVRLLQLPVEAREALENGYMSEGHARQILALKDMPEEQRALLRYIVTAGWSVRQAERYVLSVKEGAKTAEAKKRVALETDETKQLSRRYSTKVEIRRTAHGGRVEFLFKDDDELARLLNDLGQ